MNYRYVILIVILLILIYVVYNFIPLSFNATLIGKSVIGIGFIVLGSLFYCLLRWGFKKN